MEKYNIELTLEELKMIRTALWNEAANRKEIELEDEDWDVKSDKYESLGDAISELVFQIKKETK